MTKVKKNKMKTHKGTKKVLNAAALTYVASLVVSLLNLLRLLLIVMRRSDD